MNISAHLHPENIFLQKINASWLDEKNVQLDVLRLDVIDKTISGNKWFKLKYYIEDATQKGFETIATFGGAFSNHIVASAYACSLSGFQSIGIIRGEEPKKLSHTLMKAKEYGMKLFFVKRELYKNFDKTIFQNVYWINEGGYGISGANGAKDILNFVENKNDYTHFICAVGTGTTLAGIIKASNKQQHIIGISTMKNNISLEKEIIDLLNENDHKNFTINHDHHFGGYAKHTNTLIDFMNETFAQHNLPTDFVYTAKTFYAIKKMVTHQEILQRSKVLMIHTGGLQGNLSLPQNALQF